jgi:hypothetical protein
VTTREALGVKRHREPDLAEAIRRRFLPLASADELERHPPAPQALLPCSIGDCPRQRQGGEASAQVTEKMPPKVSTIAPERPFVATLADRLLAMTGGDPLGLPRVTVLLPTRRAVRALRDGVSARGTRGARGENATFAAAHAADRRSRF